MLQHAMQQPVALHRVPNDNIPSFLVFPLLLFVFAQVIFLTYIKHILTTVVVAANPVNEIQRIFKSTDLVVSQTIMINLYLLA